VLGAVVASCAVCLQPTEAGVVAEGGVSARPLTQLALRASQVGPGYRAEVIPGGGLVRNQVSLDLCSVRFLSEESRSARLQLAYTRRGSPLQLSNEVVRYTRGGAELAFNELSATVALCPRKPRLSPVRGVGLLAWRLKRIEDSRLLPSSLALEVQVTRTYEGKRQVRQALFVYQVRGDVLSAVYTYGGTLAAQRRFGLRAAAESARNLRGS
jgi:hypothetical protein